MTAGFFAPLPPAPSGVADHAVDLLQALRKQGDVRLGPAAVNLYHLGNNHLHRAIYTHALKQPGIAILHDAVLHHFLLGGLTRDEYIAEFVYNYGEWTRDLAADLWRDRARSAADARYFQFPMLRRVAETSRAIVVHNPAAARMVRQHAPGARVHEIPLLFTPKPACAAPGKQPLAGVFGHLRESKRLRSILRACDATQTPLLLAGAMPSDLHRALQPSLRSPLVRRVGPTPTHEFQALAAEVGVCINLRYPPAGETSAIGVHLMGIGKPVVFTDSDEISRYPADVCIRVDSGLRETPNLEDVLRWLKQFPSHAREIGARAARYIAGAHNADLVATRYWEVIRSVA